MITSKEFKLFQEYIEKNCGIVINEDKTYLVESRVIRLLIEFEVENFEALYNKLNSNSNSKIADKIIEEITTNETLWFRDGYPWKILEDVLLPNYIAKLRKKEVNKIRIWSAASSTGQEAYSTVIIINEFLDKNNIKDVTLSDFEIIATDISGQVLEIAKKGRYDPISMKRGIDEYFKLKYFSKKGNTWEIADFIKNRVDFRKMNLQSNFILLGKFDIVLCRYVMIYFSNKFKNDLLQKIYNILVDDGVLFIGSSELLYNNKHKFKENEHKNGIYYTK